MARPKKKRNKPEQAGAASLKRRGLTSVLVSMPPALRSALARAAEVKDTSRDAFAREAIEERIRSVLAEAGEPFPDPSVDHRGHLSDYRFSVREEAQAFFDALPA